MQKQERVPKPELRRLDKDGDLPHFYLLVGQGGIFKKPTLVQTVLGSCVSVTMYAPRERWGGIFHALLPRRRDFISRADESDCFRYVDSAILWMLRTFKQAGIERRSLECKVFGGASPLKQRADAAAGTRNVNTAMAVLEAEGMHVMASSVGGHDGRKLFFRTDTGVVLQKRFAVTSQNPECC